MQGGEAVAIGCRRPSMGIDRGVLGVSVAASDGEYGQTRVLSLCFLGP